MYTHLNFHTPSLNLRFLNLVSFIIICFFASSVTAQRKNDPNVLTKNTISELKIYSHTVSRDEVLVDSLHIVTRKYNKKGQETYVLLHDSIGTNSCYEYIYGDDEITHLETN